MMRLILATILCLTLISTSWTNEVHKDYGYIVQQDHISCGPISIVNALKVLKFKFDEMDTYRNLFKLCKTREYSGTTTYHFEKALYSTLKEADAEYFHKRVYSTKEVLAEIRVDNVIILGGHWRVGNTIRAHYFIVHYYEEEEKWIVIGLYKGDIPAYIVGEDLLSKGMYLPSRYPTNMYVIRRKK